MPLKNLSDKENNYLEDQRKTPDSRPNSIDVQKQQEQILKDARSFGAYLWTSNDLRNALLWFGETNDHNNVSYDDETSIPSNCQKEDSGKKRIGRNDVLRTLLFNRGLLDYCSGRIRSKNNIGNQSIFSSGKIVSKEEADDAFKKLKKNRLKRSRDQEPLLKHVIKEYWNSSSMNTLNEFSSSIRLKSKDETKILSHKNKDGEHSKKLSNIPKSQGKFYALHRNITDIATARLMTQKLYNLSKITSETVEWAEKRASKYSLYLLKSKLSEQNKSVATIQTLQILIDSIHASNSYFSSPETAIMRAYAIQLYLRLLKIFRTPKDLNRISEYEDTQNIHLEGKIDINNENETAIQFLKKLRKLALRDERIQQVHLFMLLGPQLLNIPEDASLSIHANKNSLSDSDVQCFLCDSALTCAQELVSVSQKNTIVEGENLKSTEESSSLSIHSNLWNLNSYLLCAVSNVHSRIGKVYINHLIHAAIIVYCNNSNSVAINELNYSTNYFSTPSKKKTMSLPDTTSNEEFSELMGRLINLGATSESLLSLIFDYLHSIEFKLTVDAKNRIEFMNKDDKIKSTQKKNQKELEVVHFIMDKLEESFPFFDVSNKF